MHIPPDDIEDLYTLARTEMEKLVDTEKVAGWIGALAKPLFKGVGKAIYHGYKPVSTVAGLGGLGYVGHHYLAPKPPTITQRTGDLEQDFKSRSGYISQSAKLREQANTLNGQIDNLNLRGETDDISREKLKELQLARNGILRSLAGNNNQVREMGGGIRNNWNILQRAIPTRQAEANKELLRYQQLTRQSRGGGIPGAWARWKMKWGQQPENTNNALTQLQSLSDRMNGLVLDPKAAPNKEWKMY